MNLKTKIAVCFVATIVTGAVLWHGLPFKSEANKDALAVANIEFEKMRNYLEKTHEDYEPPKPIHITGSSQSFIWRGKNGNRPILVRITSDGWATAMLGTDETP